jgi:hypothetical protein
MGKHKTQFTPDPINHIALIGTPKTIENRGKRENLKKKLIECSIKNGKLIIPDCFDVKKEQQL